MLKLKFTKFKNKFYLLNKEAKMLKKNPLKTHFTIPNYRS